VIQAKGRKRALASGSSEGAAAKTAFPGLCLASFEGITGGSPRIQIGIGKLVTAFPAAIQVGGQLLGTQRRPFLDADVMFQEKREVGGDDKLPGVVAFRKAIEPVDTSALALAKTQVA